MIRVRHWLYVVAWVAVVCGCKAANATEDAGGSSIDAGVKPGKALSIEELKDPESCKTCHPVHYTEWSGSMHAYAATDPVFLAMNRRGQEETNGELGMFCIQCHAPMAVREMPFDTDWSKVDPEELPEHQKGVTCYFCHNAVGVNQHFNGDVWLANDTTMRGGIMDPVEPKAHKAKGSVYHDRRQPSSSLLCGGCHDIVTPAPHKVELERTFTEYKSSVFSRECTKDAKTCGFLTCQSCHMPSNGQGVVAKDPNTKVGLRPVHSHMWPGVDVALTDFPEREAQRTAVENALSYSIGYCSLNVDLVDMQRLVLTLETRAGHRQPSGATQDRRMWTEIRAHDFDGTLIFESGVVGDQEVEEKPKDDPNFSKNPVILRDRMFDLDGNEVHMFWEAASVTKGCGLPTATGVLEPGDTECFGESGHTLALSWPLDSIANIIKSYAATVNVKVRMRPIGQDVLQNLVDSGHLDSAIASQMPTFTVLEMEIKWKDPNRPMDYTVTELTDNQCEQ